MKWLLTFPESKPSLPFYRDWLSRGGIDSHVLLPGEGVPNPKDYQALLLSGGGDVEPGRYGEERHPRTDGINADRDRQEMDLINEFMAAGRPVFGICRGLQILNVAFGGGLLQHVPDAAPGEVHSIKDSYKAQHGLSWDGDSRMGSSLAETRDSNSSHHQAANPARLGRGLRAVARSPAGIIEAIEGFDGAHRVSAVQWHPERLPEQHPAARGLRDFWKALA